MRLGLRLGIGSGLGLGLGLGFGFSCAGSASQIDGAYLTLGMILSHGRSTESKAIFFSILGAAKSLTASACEGKRPSARDG